jgi:hypothetical protein
MARKRRHNDSKKETRHDNGKKETRAIITVLDEGG